MSKELLFILCCCLRTDHPPGSSSDGALRNHEPRLELPVAISVVIPHLYTSLYEGQGYWSLEWGLLYSQVASSAMVSSISSKIGVTVIFRLLEIIQHIFISPTRVTKISPLVIVSFIASDIEHVVQYRRPSKNLIQGYSLYSLFEIQHILSLDFITK